MAETDPPANAPDANALVSSAVSSGKAVDFTDIPSDQAARKTIAAGFLRECILRRLADRAPTALVITIKGAIIDGDLSLDGLGRPSDPLPALDLSKCVVNGTVDLSNSSWMSVRLDECTLRGLKATCLTVESTFSAGDLTLDVADQTTIDLEGLEAGFMVNLIRIGRRWRRGVDSPRRGRCAVVLRRSRIRGAVVLAGARLSNPDGTALDLDNASITGHLILRADGHRFACEGTIWMLSAKIGGQVDFDGVCIVNRDKDAIQAEGLEVGNYFFLRKASVRGRITFDGARLAGLVCSGAHLVHPGRTALSLDHVEIEGNLKLDQMDERRFDCLGGVVGTGIRIGGTVDCAGARMRQRGGYALQMVNCRISGDVALQSVDDCRFEARGGVCLIGSTIGGLLNCLGARLLNGNANRSALSLEGAVIGRGLFLRRVGNCRAEAVGGIRAFGAKIGGNVECYGARLVNHHGNALSLEHAEVSGSVALRANAQHDPFHAIGRVTLWNATVTGELVCHGIFASAAAVHRTKAPALSLETARIAILRMWLMAGSVGVVQLAGADVRELDDLGGSGWGTPPTSARQDGPGLAGVLLSLDGFTYGRLAQWVAPKPIGLQWITWPVLRTIGLGTDRDRWWHRSKWLERQYINDKPFPEDFFPQPHEQLAKVLRFMGHDYDARRIMTQKFAHESRCGANEAVARFFMTAYRLGFGCGYLPIRALITVVFWLLLGWASVNYAMHLNHAGDVVFVRATVPVDVVRTLSKPDEAPTSPAEESPYKEVKTRDIPCDDISPILYALDTMLPVFQLHMDGKCEFTDNTRHGRIGRHLKAGFALIGWIIVTLAALTWTGVLRREPA
jgi:hypothetical protein